MTVPVIVATSSPQLGRGMPGETIVLGPSLGTTTTVWRRAQRALQLGHPVLAWDLPGHGASPTATAAFSTREIAEGVLGALDAADVVRFSFAGISLGGVVGLELALLAPDRVSRLSMVCSLPRIGTAAAWAQRASDVRAMGTPSLVGGAAGRWFAPGFLAREPEAGARLLDELLDIDDESYALCAEALAATDLRNAAPGVAMPLTLIEGELDTVIALDDARAVAAAVPGSALHIVPGAAHLMPVERPDEVAAILLGTEPDGADR